MKKIIFSLALVIVAMFVFANPAYAQVYVQSPERSVVSVSGEASVMVVPDVAHVFLGVETREYSAHAAQQENSITMTAVLNAITALGIDDSDIQTTHFHMHPVHSWSAERDQPQIIGYSVSNSIHITVRDIDMAGEVLAAASAAGANMASNVSFGLLDVSRAYNEALALAVADATAKARVIAHALNRNLGVVANVSEFGGMGGFMPFPQPRAMATGMVMADSGVFGGGVPVQSGELAVTARIQVTFFLD
jgi:uncharacterized protein YggE